MELRELGEFGLIQRLTRMLAEAGVATSPKGASFPLVIGIGDDAAAWRIAAWRMNDAIELSTTDTVVDGVHFTRETTPWHDLGWKVMVANLSDIAAMGGVPLYALVTLGLPEDTPVADIELLYQGMIECCREYGAAIAGGDVVRSPVAFVSVTLNGVHHGQPMLRSAAKVGDLLAVTGFLGSSRGGLELLIRHPTVDSEAAIYLCQAHRRPRPRVAEGRILSEAGVLAGMDISDGLLDDLGKMMVASGMAAQVDSWRVPVHPLLLRAFPDRALRMALAGGEEYELLYAAPAPVMEMTIARIPGAAVIGRVVAGAPGQVGVLDHDGRHLPGLDAGWDHFRS
ncbi:MAG: thiamine-phosphate kinase [Dehalococcoidia bacterium]|nr:thiamine-phosphate kinase [Dehalococcoidia bacterium]